MRQAKPWCAVIGDPIEHSLSPAIHQAAYKYLGLDWQYRRIRVQAGTLDTFLPVDDSCRGLSVTMPLKQEIQRNLDFTDGLVKVTNSCNTVVFSGHNSAGFNTDVYGIAQAFRGRGLDLEGRPATILGGRATASSAIAALVELGAGPIYVVARTLYGPGTATQAASRMGVEVIALDWSDQQAAARSLQTGVVVSTVPAGVADQLVSLTPNLPAQSALLEASYANTDSALATLFGNQRGIVISGLDMLVYQAQQQIKLMTGHEVPAAVLFAAVR